MGSTDRGVHSRLRPGAAGGTSMFDRRERGRMSDHRFVERDDPDEVFALLADDTRVAILRALWEADDDEASFSELRDAVGTRDSGRFNYHLDKLVGRFVTRTGDGYALTQAGKGINGAIQAGAFTGEATVDPIALEESCTTCGGSRTLRYEDETVRVECESCPVSYQFAVPPGAFAGYDREAIPGVASRYLRATVHRVTRGFCWFCDGRAEPTVGSIAALADAPEELSEGFAERAEDIPLVRYGCRRCGHSPTVSVDLALLEHPAVAGFYYDRGIDVRERLVWDLVEMNPDRASVRGREPFRADATYEVDGDAITLVVDEDLTVLEVVRDAG